MKLYWTSEEDRKKMRRELTRDEKDIALTYGLYGFLIGGIFFLILDGLVKVLSQRLAWL